MRSSEPNNKRNIMAKLKPSHRQQPHQQQHQHQQQQSTSKQRAKHSERTAAQLEQLPLCGSAGQQQKYHYRHQQHGHKYITRPARISCCQRQRLQRWSSSLGALLASDYNLRKTDTLFMMITMLVVVAVVISENVVFAAQRDSFKPKDPSSISNSVNAIPNSVSGSGNGNVGSSNGNTNAHSGSTNNGATSTASAADTAANFSTMLTLATTTTTAKATTSTSSGSIASSSLQKASSGSNSNFASSGTSGINRNTIEVTEDTRNGPYFDKAASKNVTALLGKTAYLNCRVKNLGNKTMLLQVSWVRHRDIHLLTVGRYTYTSDQRFRAIHQPQTEDWILQIKYPQHRDSGIYECQVSTTPHMSHYIHLNVVEPSTEIIGAPDLYIESGSTINLTCVILNSPEPPAYIFWNHNNAIINYDSPRGGVSVVTNKGETTTSFLLIKSARPSDSGHYQCNPSNAKPKSVTVHVLNGEFPAAMQRAGPALHRMSPSRYLLVYLSVYLCTFAYVRRYMQPSAAAGAAAAGRRCVTLHVY